MAAKVGYSSRKEKNDPRGYSETMREDTPTLGQGVTAVSSEVSEGRTSGKSPLSRALAENSRAESEKAEGLGATLQSPGMLLPP